MVKVVVTSVSGDIVGIEALAEQGERVPLMKNEVVYLCSASGERLAAELLKVRGNRGTVQVFEDTRGLAVGDSVELTGEMLSVELGPGLLAQVYDGLQNPLKSIDERYGMFLPRGAEVDKLDRRKKWSFTPLVDAGVKLRAGQTLGTVQEGSFIHRIMIPFDQRGEVEITWIQQGNLTVDTPIARIRDEQGRERTMSMMQRWPVRRPIICCTAVSASDFILINR